MTKPIFHLRSLGTTLLILLFAGHPVLADDTEVLIGPGGQAWATPNVLFIMDTSGSMGLNTAGTTPTATDPSRLSIVQGVFEDLMNDNSGFNVGLMRFDSDGDGGFFVTPMQKLDSSTRAGIIAASDNFTAGGNTPLSETLYEAARFYGGLSVDFGDSSNPDTNHADVFTGNNYDTPISSQCQANYVVLLTDGEPTSDTDADTSISTDFLGGASCTDNCLDEVAGYLHTRDQNSNIADDQTVETYTIGFTTNQALLQDTATAGGGDYITANNAQDLTDAFADIIKTITDTNSTFSPPALAANTFSGVSQYNKLYFALFEPSAAPKWIGNVKPYAFNDSYQLVDADDNVAVDARNMFLETSRSFWSSTDDGGSIGEGGANGRLPAAANRKLYTYTGGYDAANLVPDSPNLYDATNALKNDASSNLIAGMLGLSNPNPVALETEFNNVLDTIRAADLGAPLHSQPALVTYGGTAANPDLTLFLTTNDGFLHALNADTGIEQFAFVPQELLPNLPTLASSTGTHPYGLDGDTTVWVNDVNSDHTIDTGTDHVFVYVGMRRGGNNYYALDVTDRTIPKLKWVIKGGPGGTTGFEQLGQSWSKPRLTTIKDDNAPGGTRKVLIFGGGYDTAQDANPRNTDDTIGRAIFIVDADTGTRLWWAGPTGSGADLELATLTNSIPSEVRLMDGNRDRYTDRIYVGDMRGQVFRIDLQDTLSSSTGIRLANLSGGSEANNRRFYYPPDIVTTKPSSADRYISVNIGSGYRAHPLNPLTPGGTAAPRVDDRFYALRDPNVNGAAPTNFTAITDSDLTDVTNSLVTSTAEITALNATDGWSITLGAGSGEKVLAPSLTINGTVYFTTYTPPPSVANSSCAPPPGKGRLYRVKLFDGGPAFGTTIVNRYDTSPDLPPGIPPAPIPTFVEINGKTKGRPCIGPLCPPAPPTTTIQKSYWQDS